VSVLRSWWFWTAAGLLAVVLLWRLRRGERVVAGRWSRRTARLAAVLIVAFGGGCQESEASPPPDATPSGLPQPTPRAPLTETVRTTLAPISLFDGVDARDAVRRTLSHRYGQSPWRRFVRAVVGLEATPGDHSTELKALSEPAPHALRERWVEPMSTLVRAHLTAGGSPTLSELTTALRAAERDWIRDGWLVGLVFRASSELAARPTPSTTDARALAGLYAELERHARVVHAIERTTFEAGPVRFRPWMSKAMRPGGDRAEVEVPDDFAKLLRRELKTADAGAWAREVRWLVEVAADAPEGATLHRGGQTVPLKSGDVVALRRLDLITVPEAAERPLVLDRPGLGHARLAPGATLTAWNAHRTLDERARDRIEGWVNSASKSGDQAALEHLQRELYVAHHAISAARGTATKGKPGLDMLWAMFSQ